MAGEIALGALPAEFPVQSPDEILQGRLRSGAQPPLSNQSFDFAVLAVIAHLGEMRLSSF